MNTTAKNRNRREKDMPCHQVITASVEFKVGNIELLKKAIEKVEGVINKYQSSDGLGFRTKEGKSIFIAYNSSKIIGQDINEKSLAKYSNEIKRAYSECVIDEVAKKNRWMKRNIGENKFQLQRF
jgi:hypothetical protein